MLNRQKDSNGRTQLKIQQQHPKQEKLNNNNNKNTNPQWQQLKDHKRPKQHVNFIT